MGGGSTHIPFVHRAGKTHLVVQLPQCKSSEVMSVSQPFLGLPSQSVKPALQVPLHAPAVQVRVAMLLLEHTFEQAPQLFASVCGLVSQPSVCLLQIGRAHV